MRLSPGGVPLIENSFNRSWRVTIRMKPHVGLTAQV
jgi:hypothetical protein